MHRLNLFDLEFEGVNRFQESKQSSPGKHIANSFFVDSANSPIGTKFLGGLSPRQGVWTSLDFEVLKFSKKRWLFDFLN